MQFLGPELGTVVGFAGFEVGGEGVVGVVECWDGAFVVVVGFSASVVVVECSGCFFVVVVDFAVSVVLVVECSASVVVGFGSVFVECSALVVLCSFAVLCSDSEDRHVFHKSHNVGACMDLAYEHLSAS